VALAILEGAMVALPRPEALTHITRLRSPAWSILLPGAILLGTFGVLALPPMASALVLLGLIATPLLAFVAALTVVRGNRGRLLLAVVVGTIFAAMSNGWVGELAGNMLTALGCLALGAALVRLIPRRWLPLGVLSMCIVDVMLLALGVGESAGGLLANAAAHFHAPVLTRADAGPISVDYPDLVLAAVLGCTVAGSRMQRGAAWLVTVLAGAYGLLLPAAGALPATVPIALAFVLVRWGPLPQRRRALAPQMP